MSSSATVHATLLYRLATSSCRLQGSPENKLKTRTIDQIKNKYTALCHLRNL